MNKQDYLNQFDKFRKKYPGTKRGNETEFNNFLKHKDWKEIINSLEYIIDNQINIKRSKKNMGQFVPEWKHLKTWINQRCWEEEIPIDNISLKEYSYNQVCDLIANQGYKMEHFKKIQNSEFYIRIK